MSQMYVGVKVTRGLSLSSSLSQRLYLHHFSFVQLCTTALNELNEKDPEKRRQGTETHLHLFHQDYVTAKQECGYVDV